MEEFRPKDFAPVSVERLLKKYGSGRRRKKMEPVYSRVLAEAELLAEPLAILNEYQLRDVPDLMPWMPSNTIYTMLAVCTLGPQMQERYVELVQTDILSAMVLDEITLALVTAVTRQIHGSIRERLQRIGLVTGAAYRPGVGRWPLATQHIVFTLLPGEPIGVTLDENLVMTPRHSTSLIIPIIDRR